MSEEDKGYRIVDKRFQAASGDGGGEDEPEAEKLSPEPSEAVEKAEVESAEEPADEGEKVSSESEDRESPAMADVYNIAKWVIGIMAASAWQYMGLQVNPATGKVDKDLIQARIAIDTVVFIGDKISPHLDETDRRQIRSLTNDLQINFVQQSD